MSALPYYKAIGSEEEVFRHAYSNRLPLLLKGPTGCGKSRFVERMSADINAQLFTVSCHEETSATDLIGRYIIRGSETIWIDGPLTHAVREGAILYLDEFAEARPDILVAIHSLTDHRRALYIDKTGEIVQAHPNFMLIASYNPGYQRGFKELKPSTRQRFISLAFDYPTESIEAEIIQAEAGTDAKTAMSLARIGKKIRNLRELGLLETASTRLLVDAGKLIQSGLPRRLSVRVAVVEPLTDDPEISAALTDTVNLLI